MVGKVTTPLVYESPTLIALWDFKRNKSIGRDPKKVSMGSGIKCWFHCNNGLDHSFYSAVANLKRGRGCAVCAGKQVWRGFNDFESVYPYESYFWDYERNSYKPWEVSQARHDKFYFICEEGHKFMISPAKISIGRWCSYCSGRLAIPGVNDIATTHPTIASQLDPSTGVDPSSIKTYSNKTYRWICPDDPTHIYTAIVMNRTRRGDGCPVCGLTRKRSRAEIEIFTWIDEDLLPTVEVVPNDKTVLDGKHIDIYIPALSLGFEYNGNYWHKDKGDPDGPSAQKERLAREKGVTLYTIWEDDWTSDRSTWEEFIVNAINLTQR